MTARKAFLVPLALILVLAPLVATAQLHTQVCSGLAGCGQGPENTIQTRILPGVAQLFIQLVGGLAVIFIVIAGIRLVLSYGDDGKIGAARKSILYGFAGLGLAITSGSIVKFVTDENFGQSNPTNILVGSGGVMAAFMRIAMTLFNVAFTIMIILAGIRMVTASGSPDEFKKAGEVIKWCIIGAIVVNLARVLIQAFLNLEL